MVRCHKVDVIIFFFSICICINAKENQTDYLIPIVENSSYICENVHGVYGCNAITNKTDGDEGMVSMLMTNFDARCSSGKCYNPVTQEWTDDILAPVNMQRVKRSISNHIGPKISIPLCPMINAFRPIQMSDLTCESKVKSTDKSIKVKMIKRSDTGITQNTCACDGVVYAMSCYSYFFGGVQTWMSSSVYKPSVDECDLMCEKLMPTSFTSMSSAPIPGYKCSWMKTVTDTTTVVTVKKLPVISDWVEQSFKSSEFANVCPWNIEFCRVKSGGYLYTKISVNTPKAITPPFYETELINIGTNAYVRAQTSIMVLMEPKCSIMMNGKRLWVSADGDLWELPEYAPNTTCGSFSSASGYIQKFTVPSFSNEFKLATLEYYLCLVSKQSVANSLSINIPIDPRLLTQFGINLFSTPSDGSMITGVITVSTETIVTAKCMIKTNTKFTYKCPGVYMISDNTGDIGCYDVDMQLGFLSGCVCRASSNTTLIQGKYQINPDDPTIILEDRSSMEITIQAISELTDEMKMVYQKILKPIPVYVYDNGTAIGLDNFGNYNEEWNENPLSEWWSNLTYKLKVIVTIVIVGILIVLIVIMWFTCGCMCHPIKACLHGCKSCFYKIKKDKYKEVKHRSKAKENYEEMNMKVKNTVKFLSEQNRRPKQKKYRRLSDDDDRFEI